MVIDSPDTKKFPGVECPAPTSAGGTLAHLVLQPGFYRFSPSSTEGYLCIFPENCVGGNKTGDALCYGERMATLVSVGDGVRVGALCSAPRLSPSAPPSWTHRGDPRPAHPRHPSSICKPNYYIREATQRCESCQHASSGSSVPQSCRCVLVVAAVLVANRERLMQWYGGEENVG